MPTVLPQKREKCHVWHLVFFCDFGAVFHVLLVTHHGSNGLQGGKVSDLQNELIRERVGERKMLVIRALFSFVKGTFYERFIHYLFRPIHSLSSKISNGLLVVLADMCSESGCFYQKIS